MIIKTEIIYKSHYKYYAELLGWKDPAIYLKEGRSACTLSGDSRVVLAKVESVSWECISVINLKLLDGYLNSGTNPLKFFTPRLETWHNRMGSKYVPLKLCYNKSTYQAISIALFMKIHIGLAPVVCIINLWQL